MLKPAMRQVQPIQDEPFQRATSNRNANTNATATANE